MSTHRVSGTTICLFVSLGLWVGIFYFANYEDFRKRFSWNSSVCHVREHTKNPYTCCEKQCNDCDTCDYGQPSCDALLKDKMPPGTEQDCCDGYYCCHEVCDTCEDCTTDTDGETRCTTKDCNCGCVEDTDDRLCTVYCHQCWRPSLTLSYNITSAVDNRVVSAYDVDCGRDEQCVDNFFTKYPIHVETQCWFDPANNTSVTIDNSLPKFKLFILLVVTAVVLWFVYVEAARILKLLKKREKEE